MTIIAGTKSGDVYDTYARLFAQFTPKYIPGNPNIIQQTMEHRPKWTKGSFRPFTLHVPGSAT